MKNTQLLPKNLSWLLPVAMAALLSGCTSTRIQSARQPVGQSAPPFRNVMVVGLDPRGDVREPFENDVARLLRQRGVVASTSYDRFSLDQVKGDREQIRQRLLGAGAESVLFVAVTDHADFVEGPPVSLGDVSMGAVDDSRYQAFTADGGEMETVFHIGCRFFRVADGMVIWSGMVNSTMKEDADYLAFLRNVSQTIVGRLAKDKVIP